jgi:hypothetical protein
MTARSLEDLEQSCNSAAHTSRLLLGRPGVELGAEVSAKVVLGFKSYSDEVSLRINAQTPFYCSRRELLVALHRQCWYKV